MTAKQDPNLDINYGWDLGEDNWNTGMDASLKVWRSAEDREAFPTIPEFLLPNVELPVDLDVPCNNHIQYAYELLENSGLFPDAVWNI